MALFSPAGRYFLLVPPSPVQKPDDLLTCTSHPHLY